MSSAKGKTTKRKLAVILGFLLLMILLSARYYVASETCHECSGEDCPVCALLQQCENALRHMGNGVIAKLLIFIPFLAVPVAAFLSEDRLRPETPVILKVRLNN